MSHSLTISTHISILENKIFYLLTTKHETFFISFTLELERIIKFQHHYLAILSSGHETIHICESLAQI